MGVLKVWDGTDWRKVGCHGPDTFSDDFNRANGSVGGAWQVNTAGWDIAGNVLKWNGASGTGELLYPNVFAQAADMQVDIVNALTGGGSINVGLVWNFLDANNKHQLQVNGAALAIYRIVSGSPSAVYVTTDVAKVGTGTYRIEHETDGTLRLYRNAVLLTTVTSALVTGGTKVGIYGDNTTPTLDNWTVTVSPLGRLKVWDGTQWLREACPGEVGHPLKVWDGSAWQVAACLIAPGGVYDTAEYDSAIYG